MSRNNNSRAAPQKKRGGSMLAAILFGMMLGLILAGGVAWYMLKRPNPFQDNTSHDTVKLEPIPAKPTPVPVAKAAPDAAASGVAEDKPRFEFYKVLTDKQDAAASPQAAAKQAPKPAATAAKGSGTYFLQAGAFASADDADKLKAKLAMMGMEASIQAATLPDKSVWHRVRLGPYKSADEMSKASALLKQNGVHVTQAH